LAEEAKDFEPDISGEDEEERLRLGALMRM